MDCRDYQEIKVQEKMDTLGAGCIPRSIIVILLEDLADIVKPGDDVSVNGEV
jgi:DNA helicase MCM9